MLACIEGRSSILDILLKNNADTALVDRMKCTAFIYAASYGHYHPLRQLLMYGVDTEAKDKVTTEIFNNENFALS